MGELFSTSNPGLGTNWPTGLSAIEKCTLTQECSAIHWPAPPCMAKRKCPQYAFQVPCKGTWPMPGRVKSHTPCGKIAFNLAVDPRSKDGRNPWRLTGFSAHFRMSSVSGSPAAIRGSPCGGNNLVAPAVPVVGSFLGNLFSVFRPTSVRQDRQVWQRRSSPSRCAARCPWQCYQAIDPSWAQASSPLRRYRRTRLFAGR